MESEDIPANNLEMNVALHKHLKEMCDEIFGEQHYEFVVIIPTHGLMLATLSPEMIPVCLSSVTTSLLSNGCRPTHRADIGDNGEINTTKVEMN